jgi:hypothetical protein
MRDVSIALAVDYLRVTGFAAKRKRRDPLNEPDHAFVLRIAEHRPLN